MTSVPGQDGVNATAQPLQLRDIQMPGDAPFWPPAPGWWLLLALLALFAAVTAWKVIRLRRARRRRARITAELERLRGAPCGPELAASVSALLKRAALGRYPREQVAALTGRTWVEFLDRTGGDGAFARGAGVVLADGVYAPRRDCDADALLDLAGRWLGKNL
jgi:hypothetical protein